MPLVAWLLLTLLIGLPAMSAPAEAALAVPEPRGRVTDLTSTLTDADDAALETTLAGYAARTGVQIVVLLVPTTHPEAIEEFSLRVAESWRPGQQGKDNGALLLIAKNDRKMRIEVGYGLEARLTDASAKRVIAETLTPAFQRGDFAAGIAQGVEHLIALIDGVRGQGTTTTFDEGAANTGDNPEAEAIETAVAVIFGSLFAAVTSFILFASGVSKPLIATAIGVPLLVAWTVATTMSGFIGLALAGMFMAMFASVLTKARRTSHLAPGTWAIDGDTSGSSGGFDSDSSSSSFDSGGDFGGGGASGSW